MNTVVDVKIKHGEFFVSKGDGKWYIADRQSMARDIWDGMPDRVCFNIDENDVAILYFDVEDTPEYFNL